MTRISVVTENGRSMWFDSDAAGCSSWKEDQRHDGNNFISVATGSQWHHEHLYRTAKGAWVLSAWSQWQGSRETYTQISATQAAAWLIANDHAEAVERYLPAEMAASEM